MACLPVLLDALWRERRVGFVYAGPLCEARVRNVDPFGLVAKGATWYLVAKENDEARTWRVSRMRDAVLKDEISSIPAEFVLSDYWERSVTEFRAKLPQYDTEFLVQPEVLRWVKYRGWRLLESAPEGNLTAVRLRFDAEEEALQFALSFGPNLKVVAPVALREQVVAAARRIPAIYRRKN